MISRITPLLLFLSLVFGQAKININNLVEHGGKLFKINDDIPYTGLVFELSNNTGKKIVEGQYKDGIKDRLWIYWYDSGQKKAEENYKDGKRDGLWISWFSNGQKKFEDNYEDGRVEGKWTSWYETGEKREEKTYSDGIVTKEHDEAINQNDIYKTNNVEQQDQGAITYDDDAEYVGEYKDGVKHGQGTYIYTSGDKYVGEWKDDKYHGQGTYTYASGDKYVGEYKDGVKHGQGLYTWAGEWTGQKYVGEFKDDKYHGQGTYTYASGDKYVGEYKDGVKHGQGLYTWAGEWTGQKYVGEFEDGEYNGQGTLTLRNGSNYVGEWKDDKYHGQGIYTWAGEWTGQKYVGEYKDGKRSGQGTLTLRNGSNYVGEWKDDKYHGQGVFTSSYGSKSSGIWENDELVETKSLSSVEAYLGRLWGMEQRRKAMVDDLISIGISDNVILAAMAMVPMELFVPSEALESVYGNNPIPIGYDESISQPSLTAAMLQNLNLQKGDKVLELKTASGYQTVLLAQMGMDVTTIESDWALAGHLKDIFKEFDFPNIDFKVGNYLRTGWSENGPYDAIIATAAYSTSPYKIRDQLAPGGVFIVPIGKNTQELVIVTRGTDGAFSHETWMDVRFSMMPGE